MGLNFSAINLKVGETGLTELERRLDKLDQKAEKIRDQLLGTFREGITEPAGEAAKAVDEIGHHSELMSHSAMIGLGELSRGLAKVGTSGNAGAFAMKEFAGAAMRLGAALGEGGGLAGIAVLVGGALYEMFSKARTEMKKTEEQFKESIANMANESRGQDLVSQARDVWFGTPYDENGNLQNPSAVAGAFQGSLADLRSRIAKLQNETRGMIRKGAFQGGKDNESLDLLDKLLKAAEPLEKKLRDINTALDVMRSQPAEKGIIGPTSTADKPLTAEEIKRQERELQKLVAFADDVATRSTLQAMGAKITGGLGAYGAPTIRGASSILGGKGPQPADIVLTPSQKAAKETVENWEKLGTKIGTEMASTLASSLSKGFEALFAKGGNLKKGFQAMTGTLLEGLGTMFEQVGEKALVGLKFMQTIIDAIGHMNPAFGIGAAIGLIALGAAMKGAGSSMSSAGSGGGGSYSSAAPTSTFGTVFVNPSGPPSSPSAAGITPRPMNNNYISIIGKDDPQAQRQLLEMIARAQRRGGTLG